jgi:hypothetical protein
MRRIIFAILAEVLAATCGFSQITVHIAFNLANCDAHSGQLRALSELDPIIDKYILINKLDSSLTPWISERFGLKNIPSLHYRYVSGHQLTSYYDAGRSVVLIISETDTISRFVLELLPSRIDSLSVLAKRASNNTLERDNGTQKKTRTISPSNDTLDACGAARHLGLRYRTVNVVLQDGLPPIGSGVQVTSGHDQIWLIDHFFGNIFRLDLSASPNVVLELVDNVTSLLSAAELHQFGSSHYKRMAVQTDGIVSIDPKTDLPVIHLVCTDTIMHSTGTKVPEYHRILLALQESGPPSIIAVDYSARADELFPSLSPSGYIWQDELIIAPVHHFSASRNTYPLLGYYKPTLDSLKLLEAVPYDYRKPHWTRHAPYNYVNGRFCEGYFSFASAPLVVNTRTWVESDFSTQLGLSIDTVFNSIPTKYFLVDMKCVGARMTMLCWMNDALELISFREKEQALVLEWRTRIETGSFRLRSATLIANGDVVLISESLEELMVISIQP